MLAPAGLRVNSAPSAGWVRSCANYGDLLDNRRAPKALQTDKLVQATSDARSR
jgi:hypothetical protein